MENSLFETNIDVNAVGALYDVTASKIEDFTKDYLTSKGINGISSVIVYVNGDDSDRAKPTVYVFLSNNSRSLENNGSRVPKNLQYKIDCATDVRLTEEARNIITPLAGKIRSGRSDGEFYIQLNIFYVLGLMLKASPKSNRISILQATRLANDYLIRVAKTYVEASDNAPGDSKRSRRIRSIESRERNRF